MLHFLRWTLIQLCSNSSFYPPPRTGSRRIWLFRNQVCAEIIFHLLSEKSERKTNFGRYKRGRCRIIGSCEGLASTVFAQIQPHIYSTSHEMQPHSITITNSSNRFLKRALSVWSRTNPMNRKILNKKFGLGTSQWQRWRYFWKEQRQLKNRCSQPQQTLLASKLLINAFTQFLSGKGEERKYLPKYPFVKQRWVNRRKPENWMVAEELSNVRWGELRQANFHYCNGVVHVKAVAMWAQQRWQ